MSEAQATRVVFDWRAFCQLVPLEEYAETVTDLSSNSRLYPEIHGLRYQLPGTTQNMVLLEPETSSDLKMQWYFPYSPLFWAPLDQLANIYSLVRVDFDVDPSPIGNLSLRYAGKNTSSLER